MYHNQQRGALCSRFFLFPLDFSRSHLLAPFPSRLSLIRCI